MDEKSEKYFSRIDKWREKYGALTIALLCLYNVFINWGSNWGFTAFFILGVLICGTIGVFDIKRAVRNKKKDNKCYS